MQWVQLQLFITLNFVSLSYQLVVRPYDKPELNFLNIFNELIGLIVSYIILQMQDKYYDPDSHYEIGEYCVYVFYVSGATNTVIIFSLAGIDFFR